MLHRQSVDFSFWIMNETAKKKIIIDYVARMGRGEVHTEFWWGNLRERNYFGRPRRRWKDNIKMDLQEVRYWDLDWIDLGQNRDGWRAFANAVRIFEFHKMLGIS